MSDFFEPPPPPPEPPREHRQPEWFGPPDNVIGVVVPVELTLARADDLALVLRSVTAYPSGAQFDIPLLLRKQVSDPLSFMPFRPRRRDGGSPMTFCGSVSSSRMAPRRRTWSTRSCGKARKSGRRARC